MPWFNKQPDLKNNPLYLEPRVTAAETSLAEKAQQTDLNTTNANVTSTNTRIDQLIIGSGNANAETTDAHVSTAKNKTYTTLRNRLEEIESDSYFPLSNIVTNGDFSNGTTGWTASNGTIASANNELTLTISSLSDINRVSQVKNTNPGIHYFSFEIFAKYPNETKGYLNGISTPLFLPENTWSRYSSTINNASAGTAFSFYHKTNTNYVVGDTIKFRRMFLINLTEVFGSGNEPSTAEMDLIMSKFSNSWFDGITNLANVKKNLVVLAKDLPIVDSGNYFTSAKVEGALQELGASLNGANITPNRTTFLKTTPNLFNPATVTTGTIISAGGALVANASYQASDYIPITAGAVYKSTKAYDYAIFNSAKVVIAGGSPNGTAPTITAPANAAYIRITYANADASTAMFSKDKLPYAYRAYNNYVIDPVDQEFTNMIKNITVTSVSKWSGKRFVMLGDSIVWYDGHTYPDSTLAVGYPTLLNNAIGFNTVTNKGVSGACIAEAGAKTVYEDIVVTAKTVDYSSYDLAIIAGGINDKLQATPLGTLGLSTDTVFDNTTFYGAYREILDYILTSNPTIQIVLFTPLKNSGFDTANSAGNKLSDYAQAIKNIGELYALPVLDLYSKSGVNKKTLSTYTIDNLHLNNAGYQRVTNNVVVPFLQTV